MNQQIRTSLALVAALGLGWSGTAQAQVEVDCSQEIIDALGSDPNPLGCQLWKHGLGNAVLDRPANLNATYVEFRNTQPITNCGPQNDAISNAQKGTLTFEEPKDSVCDVATAGAAGCPLKLFGGGGEGADQVNRSFVIVTVRTVLPILQIANAQHLTFDGSTGRRYACDAPGVPNSDMNNLIDECSANHPGMTFVRFNTDSPRAGTPVPQCADDSNCTNGPCSDNPFVPGTRYCYGDGPAVGSDPDPDFIVYNQNGAGGEFDDAATGRTGSGQCCVDGGGGITFCEDITGTADYPNINTPVTGAFGGYRANTPLIFDGGRGSRFESSITQHSPIQEWGVCFQNREIPCTRTLPDECAIVGDVCDYAERGLRVATASNLADGSHNPLACAAAYVHFVGEPVDAATGRSRNCWIPTKYPAFRDPQPGCLLLNYGADSQPDVDCDGVADLLTQGRCHPDGQTECSADVDCDSSPGSGDGICNIGKADLCEFYSEINPFLDTNNDGVGDECQCGDGNFDGAITSLDIGATALCANGATIPACNAVNEMLLDADGDLATTAQDIGGVVAVVNGNAASSTLLCGRNQLLENPNLIYP